MRYYIIAGEASGDLHGSNLIKALKKKDSDAKFRVWGGDLMKQSGATLVKHYRDLAFMGFAEVILNLRTILKNLRFCKEDIQKFNPDVLILIDYPGFNLRIAKHIKKTKIPVFFYISPQIWAWKQSRVFQIKKWVDKMFVILPFEKEFYGNFDFDVEFVGHPLLDAIEDFKERKLPFNEFTKEFSLNEKPIIAILPGSRQQEISKMLPIMLSMVQFYPNHQFVVAGAPSISNNTYEAIIGDKPVKVISNKTYRLLQQSDAALVTSGTATLETALFQIPEVVCYKGNMISYQIAKRLVKIKYISLVNLVMDREVVKELIQEELNTGNLRKELDKLLFNKEHRQHLFSEYELLKETLGGAGASELTADLMLKTLKGAI